MPEVVRHHIVGVYQPGEAAELLLLGESVGDIRGEDEGASEEVVDVVAELEHLRGVHLGVARACHAEELVADHVVVLLRHVAFHLVNGEACMLHAAAGNNAHADLYGDILEARGDIVCHHADEIIDVVGVTLAGDSGRLVCDDDVVGVVVGRNALGLRDERAEEQHVEETAAVGIIELPHQRAVCHYRGLPGIVLVVYVSNVCDHNVQSVGAVERSEAFSLLAHGRDGDDEQVSAVRGLFMEVGVGDIADEFGLQLGLRSVKGYHAQHAVALSAQY